MVRKSRSGLRRVSTVALCTTLWCAAAVGSAAEAEQSAPSYDVLRQGFQSPPAQAKLWCYWWWLNGNTTKETISRDLTEMSREGFGGVLLVDANGSDENGNADTPAGPRFASPEWTALYVHALQVASQLHLKVLLNATSGWNTGGPDVKPAEAAKLLTWSRVQVDARGFDGTLPMPAVQNGFYQQIAVLAYPLAHGAALPGTNGDGRAPIRDLEPKTAAVELGFSMPSTDFLLTDNAAHSGEQDTTLERVVDVSGSVDTRGHLRWRPPGPGTWEILRIGYTDSDARVATSSDTWQGLAIDYLDRKAFDTYWDHTLVPLLQAAKPYLGSTLIGFTTDSWELGGTNWTGRFADVFRRRRGYDPIPYLPVVVGRIVGDRAKSDAFLNDLRRTVGDLVTDHYDHFAERAKEYGLGIQCEPGGPHGAPFDALETFRSAIAPQTEFWAKSDEHRSADKDRLFVKEAASAADIYGKALVAQEGLTSIGPQWSESLATDLKPTFDQAVTEGMNRLVWHEFTSSPDSTGLPGDEYFAGTHLNPKITWWNQGEAFFTYLNRAQFLMQQGYSVDDVLYFYGDAVPNFVRLKQDDPAKVLPGYDYDVTNEDALLHSLTVRGGNFVTPAGNEYRLLVMPRSARLSLASLRRIAEFVREGGSITGPRPLAPTGILSAAEAEKFEGLKEVLWPKAETGTHRYGSGTVFCDGARAALQAMGVALDFESSVSGIDYAHRRAGQAEIYFVRNEGATAQDFLATFRVAGRMPEVWDAVTGGAVSEARYSSDGGRTKLTLHLDPYGSAFVIFAKPEGVRVTRVLKDGVLVDLRVEADAEGGWSLPDAEPGAYTLELSDGRQVGVKVGAVQQHELAAAEWKISFQSGRGAPAGEGPVAVFRSWTESDQPGVRYFSGTGTYSTALMVHRKPGERITLHLTDVREVCTVRVNGKDAGTVWAMPYALDITDFVKNGENRLELAVTNLWPNRIIGDAQPDATQTFTHTNIRKYTAKSPLLPSGLIGPVVLERQEADAPIALR